MNDLHDENISKLYKKTRIEEPPMALDSAILTQARKVVEKRSLWRRTSWLVPLTTVALTVLTVSVVIQMKQEHPEIIAPVPHLQTEGGVKDDRQQVRSLKDKEEAEKRAATSAPSPAMEMKSEPAEKEMAPARTLMIQPKKREAVGASQFRSRDKLSETDSAAPSQAEVLKSQVVPDPETWIKKIRQLLKQDKKDEATEELKAFRAAYPDYKLPDDLNQL